jgi:hypothetical protein
MTGELEEKGVMGVDGVVSVLAPELVPLVSCIPLLDGRPLEPATD